VCDVLDMFSGYCEFEFLGKAKEDKTADLCPEGCTYVGEVKATRATTYHSPVVQREHWTHMAGVCRSEGDAASLEAKPNGRYSKTAGTCDSDGVCAPATQEQCMDHCAVEPDCIGYAHGEAYNAGNNANDNSWCLNYGPNLHDVEVDDPIWISDNHLATTITQTKPNPAYICGVKDAAWFTTAAPATTVAPTAPATTAAATAAATAEPDAAATAEPDAAATTAKPDGADTAQTQSMCQRAAMVALSLWLTGFLQ
jgi:hypothetical protein